MGKRSTYRVKCGHEGCREWATFEAPTRIELRRGYNRWRDSWLCERHSQPGEVLSAANSVREVRLTLVQSCGGKYWSEGVRGLKSGFEHGPGFKAYADDFPVGTVLVVTARVEIAELDSDGKERAHG